jgi:hypothetical protein
MTHNPAFDQSIPVLTEVFSDKAEQPPPPRPVAYPVPGSEQANAELETRAVDNWTEPQWNLLERRLSERILQQLQGRVDFVLEQRLRDSMEEVLKAAMAGLTEDIRAGLQDTIEKIVVRAVAQEVSHLQSLKK